jgi:hypothetical protein
MPLRDDGRVSLICIWIGPKLTAYERQQCSEDFGPSGINDGGIAKDAEVEGLNRRNAAAPGRSQLLAGSIP